MADGSLSSGLDDPMIRGLGAALISVNRDSFRPPIQFIWLGLAICSIKTEAGCVPLQTTNSYFGRDNSGSKRRVYVTYTYNT